MKVKIGPYIEWFGPYQLAEKLMFWADKHEDKRVHKFGELLDSIKPLSDFLGWIYSKCNRKVSIKLDRFDSWNADNTISLIVAPLLKQLKATQHGAPNVDDEDVPEELRRTAVPAVEEWETDDNHFKRWEWVLDEMIWAHEQHTTDWQEQYHKGKIDIEFVKVEGSNLTELVVGPNDTHKFDLEGYNKHNKRITNGFRLFGKYYQALWD